jgi:hypothetical protein
MSTFNIVFCQGLYEKGQPIDAASLKGPDGGVLSTVTDKGDDGLNGKLKIKTITTLATDTKIDVPDALNSDFDVYHVVKPIESTYDIHIMNHLNVEICTFYASHIQELMLYKRDNEWVF